MNPAPPGYFEHVRLKSVQRWEQLDSDPELAAPWHQMFRQVQSPRHVVSELLQNADDAAATEASVRLEPGRFQFSHNGEDFTEEHFASLCRFAYSNKRALHTIGFRGVGFKSVFSLGDRVELYTPTLSVAFSKARFTEPVWVQRDEECAQDTQVRVAVEDELRLQELRRNLREWRESPISLLFFRSIRRLSIDGDDLCWARLGRGPVPGSEWLALNGDASHTVLVVRSEPLPFPQDALEEIGQERLLPGEQQESLPPCTIDLVVGSPGRLYVVLPTGVTTQLPFACNAPFIQDPARLKIKDPEISPTNRWLLEKTGELAASAMLRWLEGADAPMNERAAAYALFPNVNSLDDSLESTVGRIVQRSFENVVRGQPFLLTQEGDLVPRKKAVVLPQGLRGIWPPGRSADFLDLDRRPFLCEDVSDQHVERLENGEAVERVGKERVLQALQTADVPKPETWYCLLRLWSYLRPDIDSWLSRVPSNRLRIVPVQGQSVLFASEQVVRLGRDRLLGSEEDWQFLSDCLLVMNPNWQRYLSEQLDAAQHSDDVSFCRAVGDAHVVLGKLGLIESSNADRILGGVVHTFHSQAYVSRADWVRLAQIAAKLEATAASNFPFITRDGSKRTPADGVMFDGDGSLEALVPENLRESRLLHCHYNRQFRSCTPEEWIRWVSSGRSGLRSFVQIVPRELEISRSEVVKEARRRGATNDLSYPYRNTQFILEDWDFDDTCWRHWESLAATSPGVWASMMSRILRQPDECWKSASKAQLVQVATTGRRRSVSSDPLLPGWILRLRELPCLPDTFGKPRLPRELLRRTPQTEPLMGIESFVDGRLDTQGARPLLDLLGVSGKPLGPDRILDRLSALAGVEGAPAAEVDQLYRRLDQFVSWSSPEDLQVVASSFRDQSLLLTEDGSWVTSADAFIAANAEDVPGAPVVRAGLEDLSLWRKIGVSERPTSEIAMAWLRGLPSNVTLAADDLRRARALLGRHSVRVWNESGRWLNLDGALVQTEHLKHSLSMSTLIPWRNLSQSTRRRTADCQFLSAEVLNVPPFTDLPPLSSLIEERLALLPPASCVARPVPWLRQFGSHLTRIVLDDPAMTARLRLLGQRLFETMCRTAPGLLTIPYIGGEPAGTSARTDVAWIHDVLYVEELPAAKLARLVPEKIGKALHHSRITEALHYCYDRTPEQVDAYFQENFELEATAAVLAASAEEPGGEPQGANTHAVPAEPSGNGARWAAEARHEPVGLAGDSAEVEDNPGHQRSSTTDNASDPGRREYPRQTHAQTPGLIERFAASLGFRSDGSNRYVRGAGDWIGRSDSDRALWEMWSGGQMIQVLWPREHCLHREPLEIESSLWDLITQQPDIYSLVLLNEWGEPEGLPGNDLLALVEERKVQIYPAAYRLVHELCKDG